MGNAFEQCCSNDDDAAVLMQKIYDEKKNQGKKKKGIMTNALDAFKLEPLEDFEQISEFSREDSERDFMAELKNKETVKQRRSSIDSINSYSTDIQRVEQDVRV